MHSTLDPLSRRRSLPATFVACLLTLALTLAACAPDPTETPPEVPPRPTPGMTPPAAARTEPPPPPLPTLDATKPCGDRLQPIIDAAAPGERLDMTGCTYGEGIRIDKPLTIVGARFEFPDHSEGDRWRHEIVVLSSDVTLDGIVTRGGANIIGIEGDIERVTVRNADMREQIGSAIWAKGAVHDTVVENTTIVTRPDYIPPGEPGVSPIRVEGCSPWPCEPLASGTIVRDSYVDQGPRFPSGPGWFGIELIRAPDALIERTTVKGGHTRISLPNSDGTIVRNNVLDLTGPAAVWGIEVAGASNIHIIDNVFDGGSPDSEYQAAISWNATSNRVPEDSLVQGNVIRDLDAAFQVSGQGHTITDNCLSGLNRSHYEYGGPIGDRVVLERNGPCEDADVGSMVPEPAGLGTPAGRLVAV